MKHLPSSLVVAIAAGAAAYWLWAPGTAERKVQILDPASVVLIRTEGGNLQVSEMRKPEVFGWQTGWRCPLVDCSSLPKTTSTVQVTASYVYRIPLAAQWRLDLNGDHYTLTVPPIELQSPVGIDTADLRFATVENSLFSPATAPHREVLLRQLGPELAQRGGKPEYLRMQQPAAEATVREFAQKWMHRDGRKIDRPIRVIFKASASPG
jgi:hypothetical protein